MGYLTCVDWHGTLDQVPEKPMAMLESMDFPEELVINSSLERLRDYFFQLRQIDILAE